MYKYAIVMKQIAASGGVEHLEKTKRTLFDGLVYAVGKGFEAAKEIDDVQILPDFTIILTANEDVYPTIKSKLGDNVIITQLEN